MGPMVAPQVRREQDKNGKWLRTPARGPSSVLPDASARWINDGSPDHCDDHSDHNYQYGFHRLHPECPHKTDYLTYLFLAAGELLQRTTGMRSRRCEMTSDFGRDRLPLNALRRRIKTAHEDEDHRVSFRAFSQVLGRRIILHMALQNSVRDTFTLSGDDENRLVQLVEPARHQARVAQTAAAPRMQDALTDIRGRARRSTSLPSPMQRKTTRPTPKHRAIPDRSWRPLRAA